MSTEHAQPVPDQTLPGVLIVGAGLGGLLLGALLERINVPYHIFERASQLRALGSAMALGSNILPVFEQLGLLEEIEKISLPCPALEVYKSDLKKLGSVVLRSRACTGYDCLIFPRPELYELLRKQVPAHNITLNKKVLRTEEKDNRVFIHCSDNTTYEGDILVGADGAYSGVRQSLYKRLDEQGLLPKVDLENFSIGVVAMVGVTESVDPDRYPVLKDDYCHFSSTVADMGVTWNVTSVRDNRICWLLGIQLSESDAQNQQFRNSEWGPESNEAMIKEFRDRPCPWGGTMGEIIDATPKDLVSKVFLEEKVFKTWYHGRTVLLGDAAHKMMPSAGLGAMNAMQDAVVLANCLYSMPDASSKSLKTAFKEYYRQRYDRSNVQFERSRSMAKITAGRTLLERVLRYVLLNYIPRWVQQRDFAQALSYRPQIAWLPTIVNRGTGPVQPQEGPWKGKVENANAV